ncbi:hypothetical protein, partial [Geobacillus sp. MR]|uniref:hypothetical protein n=1 Tax=Geobacillus sp. MR TaxID=2508875 RepID=UPI001C0F2F70
PVSPWFRYSAHLLGVAEASFLSSISPSSYLHNKTACRLCRQAEHCLTSSAFFDKKTNIGLTA